MLRSSSSPARALLAFAVLCSSSLVALGARAESEPEELPPPPELPWYEALSFGAFADAYASVNYAFPKPQTGSNRYRAYETSNGFALAWVGLNVAYDPEPVGGVLQLRFGPQAQAYASASERDAGLANVKQAYASWKLGEAVSLDFGKFDTPHGAEVADSQLNYNYTRGALYWLAQPLYHTGLRANFTLLDELSAKAMVINGWNNSVDNNAGKTFCAHLSYAPLEELALSAGWIGGPEQPDSTTIDCPAGETFDADAGACISSSAATPAQSYVVDRAGANKWKAWKHVFDLLISVTPTEDVATYLNAYYGTEGVRDATNTTNDVDNVKFYGAALAGRLALSDVWAVAARAEYIGDPDGYLTTVEGGALGTGTLTLEAKPTKNLILRLEPRADVMLSADDEASKRVFQQSVRDSSKAQITTTLGVVVTTD